MRVWWPYVLVLCLGSFVGGVIFGVTNVEVEVVESSEGRIEVRQLRPLAPLEMPSEPEKRETDGGERERSR